MKLITFIALCIYYIFWLITGKLTGNFAGFLSLIGLIALGYLIRDIFISDSNLNERE